MATHGMLPTTLVLASIRGTALITDRTMTPGGAPGPTLIISQAGLARSATTWVTHGTTAGIWGSVTAGAAIPTTTTPGHGILTTDIHLTGTLPTIATLDGVAAMATILPA